MRLISKPEEGEYAPYTIRYIGLLPDDGLVLTHLAENFSNVRQLISALPAEKLVWRYQPDKWTIKEILVHIIDDERIYAYRALRFARDDATPLPGFDQDFFTQNAGANDRPLDGIFNEYEAVRRSTIELFNGFDDSVLLRAGKADGRIMSVRAAAYHIAGHELHHLNIIKARYL
jgi:uncharacterized damage-inducible protein DinB